MTPTPSTTSLDAQMLFLVSHGLQTPLSAIRWGCGRLQRLGDNLTEEQTSLLDEVREQSRLLSYMFDLLLLLASVKEHAHVDDMQQIYLYDFLHSDERIKSLPRSLTLDITCPESVTLRADRTLCKQVIDALLLTIALSSKTTSVAIEVQTEKEQCVLTFRAPMEWSFVEEAVATNTHYTQPQRIVGGVPGFLLAVAASLAQVLEGKVESIRDAAQPAGFVLRIPLQPPLPSFL